MPKKNDRPRDMANDILNLVREGTKKWTRTRKAEERAPASRSYRYERMTRERGVQFKEAAAEIMEKAYLKASDNGKLPANARQIMYAARKHIQERTGQPLRSNYFTQVLLPDYLQETGVKWNVVWDARGHFAEPHGGVRFGLGHLEVRDYLAGLHDHKFVEAGFSQATVETSGPSGNFGAVLFIEKEGFDQLLKEAKIDDKFDVAIKSTKGMSVTAARELADEMCHAHDIPLLLLHDFDKSGFAIAGTIQRDTRRYEFRNTITTIDLSLSLEDVKAMRLDSEYQHYPKGNKAALMANLRTNGASEDEITFMFQDFDQNRSTRRVELNAMTSPQFIAFVERKLREVGIAKIVPDQESLAEVYAQLERGRRLLEAAKEIDEIDMDDFDAPKDLPRRVRKCLKEQPTLRWDAALAEIIKETPDRRRRRKGGAAGRKRKA
jgi:hypothetical protein